jgi:multidrug transporter EmrE-like cation transporter
MSAVAWALFGSMCIFELIADVLGKQYALSGTPLLGWSALGGYMAANSSWVVALRKGFLLSLGGVYFGVITGTFCVVIGCVFYKEPVSRLQMLGMTLGIVSSGLLAMGGKT